MPREFVDDGDSMVEISIDVFPGKLRKFLQSSHMQFNGDINDRTNHLRDLLRTEGVNDFEILPERGSRVCLKVVVFQADRARRAARKLMEYREFSVLAWGSTMDLWPDLKDM